MQNYSLQRVALKKRQINIFYNNKVILPPLKYYPTQIFSNIILFNLSISVQPSAPMVELAHGDRRLLRTDR